MRKVKITHSLQNIFGTKEEKITSKIQGRRSNEIFYKIILTYACQKKKENQWAEGKTEVQEKEAIKRAAGRRKEKGEQGRGLTAQRGSSQRAGQQRWPRGRCRGRQEAAKSGKPSTCHFPSRADKPSRERHEGVLLWVLE